MTWPSRRLSAPCESHLAKPVPSLDKQRWMGSGRWSLCLLIVRTTNLNWCLQPIHSSSEAVIEFPILTGGVAAQFLPEQATDGHIETFSRSALSPKLCSCLQMWARRRETRLGIEVVFRMKSSAPASSEAVS